MTEAHRSIRRAVTLVGMLMRQPRTAGELADLLATNTRHLYKLLSVFSDEGLIYVSEYVRTGTRGCQSARYAWQPKVRAMRNAPRPKPSPKKRRAA